MCMLCLMLCQQHRRMSMTAEHNNELLEWKELLVVNLSMLDSVRGLSTFADIYQPSTSGGGLYATLISTVAELSYIVAGFSLLRIASSWPAFPSQCTSSLKLISTVIQNNYAILFEYFGIFATVWISVGLGLLRGLCMVQHFKFSGSEQVNITRTRS